LKRVGGSPAAGTDGSETDTRKMAVVERRLSLKNRQSHTRAAKTHIADLPPYLQRLLAEEFERGIIGLHEKFEAEYSRVKRDRDKLANLNEGQSARIQSLTAALEEVGARVHEQDRRIEQLKDEIAAERESREKMEQRIRDARKELTKVELQLDEPFPESGGGA
jgi:chromosome segregation ATPase